MARRAVYITRTGVCLPNAPVGNDAMERILGQVGPRPSRARKAILRSNGILSRHYAIDPETLQFNDTNAGMTAKAVHEPRSRRRRRSLRSAVSFAARRSRIS